MTLIVSVTTPELSLLIGDARITFLDPVAGLQHKDCCQKIHRLSHSTVFGFAGNVFAAADFLNTMPELYQRLGEDAYNRAFTIQELVLKFALQGAGVAEAFRRPDGSVADTDFVFTGRSREASPVFQTFHVNLRTGDVNLLTQDGVTAIGSGRAFFAPIGAALVERLAAMRESAARTDDPSHYLAWDISTFLAGFFLLRGRPAKGIGSPLPRSVGILFHGMYVDKDRVTPLRFVSNPMPAHVIDATREPLDEGHDVRYVEGRFQITIGRSEPLRLLMPSEVIAGRHLQ
jgi:ATP-dependent protease HslVU (ClpYQ) peptidase subunit